MWLLKRFLYKPIRGAIDAREKLIATRLADADAKRAQAEGERDEFRRKNEELDQQRAALLDQATTDAKSERQRLLREARTQADALAAKRREVLANETRSLHGALRRQTQQEVFAIARKTLTDLATTSLEERMVLAFTRRLGELPADTKAQLADALKTTTEPARVRGAFDLPSEQRAAIQDALNETFSAEVALRFETAPDLVSGIELTVNGQKLAWSIANYLTSLEKSVGELLTTQAKSEPTHERATEASPTA